jgi:Na+/melibiose symporter-like transporter
MTEAILESVPVERAGVGAGVMQVFRQLGGALGVAIMGAILTAKLNGLTPGQPRYGTEFVSAWQTIALVAAAISFASAVIAFLAIRPRRERAPAAEAPPVPEGSHQ